MKIYDLRLKIKSLSAIFVFFLLLFLYPKTYTLKPIYATGTANCGSGDPVRSNGLVTTPSVAGKFATSGGCIVDSKVIFLPFKIPTYDELKSLYFTQAKSSSFATKEAVLQGDKDQGDIPLTGRNDHLYNVNGNLTISGNIPGGQTGVVFVDQDLTINPHSHRLTTPDNAGLVFVVGGNVIIDPEVTQIDAVIIAQGAIYTAGLNCGPSRVITSPLTINGSLIALSEQNLIKFCRKLPINTPPAEIINQQPKYLILLRNLFSVTTQKWSEVQ